MRSRWMFVASPIVGAMAFATSVWVAPWWRIGEVTIGPFSSRHCFGGQCRPAGLQWIGGSDLWMRSAIATGAAGLIAMMLLLGVAGGVAARRTPLLVSKMSLVAIASAVACAAYFVARMPRLEGMALGAGPFFFAAGAIIGAAVSLAALRRHRRA
ncbi:MAG TPA: hypothetical protein VGL61_27195 [Kofleriaceae bacterium]